ncbi:5-formyltetrahydrofolate cyclo-ligase [Bacteroides propionicifaciens]|jgi:5-formyltetrahydrofolate cyclo-ligase|uniref:5-formyltetrahydrofolate cyclo-ligase n=1 Tax=Bacteroides propionicifaciens TaxID=392838 RepID=UPI00036A93C9|nr:5-formyltetrahydrofolate cyclo-ligase [Bacteroides propionicifaciens]
MRQQKKALRQLVNSRKATYSKSELIALSEDIIQQLVLAPLWVKAQVVLLYYSLPDEVNTHKLVQEFSKQKQIILPVVVGDILELRKYASLQDLKKGAYGILEPCGELFTTYEQIDLVVVPGMAFDEHGNRLGRGKGYYDKLLPNISAPKIGLCFGFQYQGEQTIPTESTDIPMNKVITNKKVK